MITRVWFRLIIIILIILIIFGVYKCKETFTPSYPVYGSTKCRNICSSLENGYNFETLCKCKTCCATSNNGCNSSLSSLLDYFDWGDGKDCNFAG
jgi:hypothetical protein